MPWTNPAAHIFATGEVVTASTLNTYVQQNLTFLGGPYHASVHASANQADSGGTAVTLALNTIDADPNGNFNTTTHAYTVPATGTYLVTSACASALNTTGDRLLYAYHNGASYRTLAKITAVTTTGGVWLSGTTSIYCVSGDTLSIVFNTPGSTAGAIALGYADFLFISPS